jgi:hypothetical protein
LLISKLQWVSHLSYLETLLICGFLQDSLREAHEDALRKAIATFNASAVGVGSVRSKFEKLLNSSLRKTFEVISSFAICCSK